MTGATMTGATMTGASRKDDLALDPDRVVLFIIDFQERLSAAMPAEVSARASRNVCILIEAAARFRFPVVISRQYPRGLGPTLPAIDEALTRAPDIHRFDKVEFSACRAPDFPMVRQVLRRSRDQWIVTGMETHVCVYQTARQLVQSGQPVHVVQDAVVSRTKANWRVGLGLIERAGGVISATEAVVFDLLGRADNGDFKALSKLIK